MRKEETIRPFGFRDKLGYLFGDFGNDFTFILSTVLLMKFYTDVIGVSGGVVGTVIMVARFADAFTDVAMGRLCDRSRVSSSGKFRPWILRVCVPVSVASFLMYQNFLAVQTAWIRILWLTVSYLLWSSVFYTAVNIPYGSMASTISANPDDRQSLSTYRTMGGTLAGLVIGVGVPLFAYDDTAGRAVLNGERVTVLAGVFSALAIVCYLLCYGLVRERNFSFSAEAPKGRSSIGEMLKRAVKNRALISIIAASVLMLLAQLTMQNMAAYIYPDYYGSASAQSVSTVVMLAGMIVSALLAKPIARKVGKAELAAVSNLFAAGVCLLLFFVRPQSVWAYIVLQSFSWLGLGMFSMVSWALITDVIDDAELRNGVREDGSVYALYSFARKLGQALAAGVSGWLLVWIGYREDAAVAGVGQEVPVLEGIYNISTLVPAVGFALLSAVLWFWYPLRRKTVDRNVLDLEKKRKPME